MLSLVTLGEVVEFALELWEFQEEGYFVVLLFYFILFSVCIFVFYSKLS